MITNHMKTVLKNKRFETLEEIGQRITRGLTLDEKLKVAQELEQTATIIRKDISRTALDRKLQEAA
jgi:hypothetical protein